MAFRVHVHGFVNKDNYSRHPYVQIHPRRAEIGCGMVVSATRWSPRTSPPHTHSRSLFPGIVGMRSQRSNDHGMR